MMKNIQQLVAFLFVILPLLCDLFFLLSLTHAPLLLRPTLPVFHLVHKEMFTNITKIKFSFLFSHQSIHLFCSLSECKKLFQICRLLNFNQVFRILPYLLKSCNQSSQKDFRQTQKHVETLPCHSVFIVEEGRRGSKQQLSYMWTPRHVCASLLGQAAVRRVAEGRRSWGSDPTKEGEEPAGALLVPVYSCHWHRKEGEAQWHSEEQNTVWRIKKQKNTLEGRLKQE